MSSPSRIVRFRGAFPDRKSFTWESFKLSNACITLCSGRCANRPVSTFGNKVSRLPSCKRFSLRVPSCSSLSRCSKHMRSLPTFSLFEMIFLRFSIVSVRSTVRSNWPPVVGVMLMVISSGSRTVVATQPHPGCGGDDDKEEEVEEEEEEEEEEKEAEDNDDEDNDDDEDEEVVGSVGEAEEALIKRWQQYSGCVVE